MTVSKQIGWDQKTNLYWQISKQLEKLIGIASKVQLGSNSIPDGALYFVNPDDGLKYYITATIDNIKYYITI